MDLDLCKRLIIFEGPDGSGKTTTARQYADSIGARYVHFPALPKVDDNVSRMYVEAMMPALLGYQDVVFDRSWLSEVPYGNAFRDGKDRIGNASRRMLERLALRCGAVVVYCDPGLNTVINNYKSRREIEMLDNEGQLALVYEEYSKRDTHLPYTVFDYKIDDLGDLDTSIEMYSTIPHQVDSVSAGNMEADVVIVGYSVCERTNSDSFYQWPFASFEESNCQWLAKELDKIGVGEYNLLWVDADQDLSFLKDLQDVEIIALGMKAMTKLRIAGLRVSIAPHPAHRKRFNRPYKLIELLKEAAI